MIKYNLAGTHKIIETGPLTSIVADADAESPLISFYHDRLKVGQSIELKVVPRIQAAPWLEPFLKDPRGDATLRPDGEVQLWVRCKRQSTSDVALDAKQLADTLERRNLVIQLFYSHEGSSNDLPIEVNVSHVELITKHSPEFKLEQRVVDVLTLSRSDLGVENGLIVVGHFTATPMVSALRYVGQDAHIRLEMKVTCQGRDGERQLRVDFQKADDGWSSSISGTDHLVETPSRAAGRVSAFRCLLSAAELYEIAQGGSGLNLTVGWRFAVVSDNATRADRFDADMRQQQTRVEFAEGEVVQVKLGADKRIIPKMGVEMLLTTADWTSSPIPFNSSPEHVGSARFKFDVLALDTAFDLLDVYARLFPARGSEEGRTEDSSAPADAWVLAENMSLHRPVELSIPLGEMLLANANGSQYVETGRHMLQLDIVASSEDGGLCKRGQLLLAINLHPKLSGHLVCVDLGASATSIWFGRPGLTSVGDHLRLGEFIYQVAGTHSEYTPNGKNYLLPSDVGLDSEMHLRSQFDPLSLRDPGELGGDDVAVSRRLSARNRHYDVSVPSLSFDRADANQRKIIRDSKRRLVLGPTSVQVDDVAELHKGLLRRTTEVSIGTLIEDTMSELGEYVAPGALLSTSSQILNDAGGTLFDVWRKAAPSDITAVITHPSGIQDQKLEIYRRAGRRFLEAFSGVHDAAGLREPVLVPEAMAAAYFGIGKKRWPADSTHTFACVDIGAGTFDASLVEANFDGSGLVRDWKVLAHFMVPVGGAQLDASILHAIDSILTNAFRSGQTPAAEGVRDLRLLDNAGGHRALLAREIQAAKKRLTAELLKVTNGVETFDWPAGRGREIPFRLNLRNVVEARERGARLAARRVVLSDGDDPIGALSVELSPGTGHEFWLELGAERLAGEVKVPLRDDPRTVVRFLGRALPAMLAREAHWLGPSRPKPTWIITGRTSLWPPLFSEIARTVKELGGGALLKPTPFEPEEMKNAVVLGARELAHSSLNLGDRAVRPLAIVRWRPAFDGAPSTNSINSVHYLETSGLPKGEKMIDAAPDSYVVRALPGLHHDEHNSSISRDEIIHLFNVFGQSPVEELIKIDHQPGGPDKVKLEWERDGTSVHIHTGSYAMAFNDH
ncbi:hypothetical protein M2360_004893 [Rhizobium sp. SG_E_25_P2]|uniref:hypothetical protein n=1 Tax=Rhizobium sp. SG_E_25_P2 TaxID=2879942 RepID=UPI002472EE15|nr:hypothetical protein [Rhizobium sp. SG_E_25_P2]MDH6269465.1 hypothetical protein [Rhizobium sp. SG_E_25_P2]